jgi:hypothetical protein
VRNRISTERNRPNGFERDQDHRASEPNQNFLGLIQPFGLFPFKDTFPGFALFYTAATGIIMFFSRPCFVSKRFPSEGAQGSPHRQTLANPTRASIYLHQCTFLLCNDSLSDLRVFGEHNLRIGLFFTRFNCKFQLLSSPLSEKNSPHHLLLSDPMPESVSNPSSFILSSSVGGKVLGQFSHEPSTRASLA